MSTMTDFQMTNEEKADVFFKVAMEYLDLQESDTSCTRQVNPVANLINDHSPYICDCISAIVGYTNVYILKDEMHKFGMPHFGFGVWEHIPATRRQEARWFFLMLMVEYLDDADNEEISN